MRLDRSFKTGPWVGVLSYPLVSAHCILNVTSELGGFFFFFDEALTLNSFTFICLYMFICLFTCFICSHILITKPEQDKY